MSEDRFKLPDCPNYIAHPQSVWFENHWRPTFVELEAKLGAAEKEIERLSGVAQREIQRMQEAFLGEQSAVLEAIRNQLTRERAINDVLSEALERLEVDTRGCEYSHENIAGKALKKTKEMRDGE